MSHSSIVDLRLDTQVALASTIFSFVSRPVYALATLVEDP